MWQKSLIKSIEFNEVTGTFFPEQTDGPIIDVFPKLNEPQDQNVLNSP
jgi:hypothetical protein